MRRELAISNLIIDVSCRLCATEKECLDHLFIAYDVVHITTHHQNLGPRAKVKSTLSFFLAGKSVSVTRPVLSLHCHLCQHFLGYFNTQKQSSALLSQVIVLSFLLFVVMQQTHGKWTLHLNHLVFFSAVFLEVLHLTGSYIGGIDLSIFMI